MKKSKLISMVLSSTLLFGTFILPNNAVYSEEDTPKTTIYIASDSTVANWPEKYNPQGGWGMFLGDYFTSDVEVKNKAIAGISSKTYVTEGHLDKILQVIKPNDYLFIQFGHNDATPSRPLRYTEPNTTFKEYINKHIDGAREKGAIPVLVTPVARRSYNEKSGLFNPAYKDYSDAMKQIAKEKNVGLLDLSARSRTYLAGIGIENSKSIFLFVKAGEYPEAYYSKGIEDKTHFQKNGANIMARLVVEELLATDIALKKYVKDITLLDNSEIKTFSDIKGHWAKTEIEEMLAVGFTKGATEANFEPERIITRAEFIALIARGIKLQPTTYKNEYKDVEPKMWYADIVQAAADAKIINGDMLENGNLLGGKPITREEMASIVSNAFVYASGKEKISTGDISSFADADKISGWALDDVKAVHKLGLISGITATEFAPINNATRAQAIVIIRRMLQMI